MRKRREREEKENERRKRKEKREKRKEKEKTDYSYSRVLSRNLKCNNYCQHGTVYNPLTASSYWRMVAVLTELRHDAVIGLPGTQKRVAVDAPPYQQIQLSLGSFMGISTWCLRVKQKCWCVVALLVSLVQTRTFATGMLPTASFERTMRSCGGKKRVLYLPPKPSGTGEATLWRKTLDAVYKWTDGLLMSLPTRCMPVLMLDPNDRLGRPRAEEPHDLIGTLGAGVEGDSATRFRALVRRHSIAVPQTFHLVTLTFLMVRMDDHESILLPHLLLCNFVERLQTRTFGIAGTW